MVNTKRPEKSKPFSEYRKPPQDLDAERSVLGAMLLSELAIHTAQEHIKDKDFYREANQEIFRAIVALRKKSEPVDAVTLGRELKTMGVFEQVGGATEIRNLVAMVPTAANVEYYAKIVKECSKKRWVIQSASKAVEQAYQDEEDSEVIVEKLISDVSLAENFSRTLTSAEMAARTYERATDKKTELLIPTGWEAFDDQVGGIRRGVLTVVTGESEVGKSTGIQNVVVNVAKENYRVAYLYADGLPDDLPIRQICLMNDWSAKRWESTDERVLSTAQKSEAVHKWEQLKVIVGGRKQFGNQWESMKLWMIREWKRNKVDLFVIDGGERIHCRVGYGENKWDAQEKVVDELEQLAAELNVGLVVIVGQAKKSKDKFRVVDEDEVGTNAWRKYAALRLFVSRDPQASKDPSREFIALVKITKNRNYGGKGTFWFEGTKDTYKWTEIEGFR